MRILAIDMGTGTQDILLFDSSRSIENSLKMVLPSATEVAARRIRAATGKGERLILSGAIAGGGPCSWALEEFIAAGGLTFATPDAAQTFDDDLDRVREIGVTVVSEDEAAAMTGIRVVLGDLDLEAIAAVFRAFEEPLGLDGIAVGCLDHGAAPPDVSDRKFRFDHLRGVVERRNDLLAFACRPCDLAPYLTRARAMAAAAEEAAPVAFMDTGPAAALGAIHDERLGGTDERVVLNLGNMHLLGFHLAGRRIASLFEHHTGELKPPAIEQMTRRMADGSLTDSEVFNSKGHGGYHADRSLVSGALPTAIAVTGPRRDVIRQTALPVCMAAPFGDMMISGCFGLLRGFAEVYPKAADAIASRLGELP